MNVGIEAPRIEPERFRTVLEGAPTPPLAALAAAIVVDAAGDECGRITWAGQGMRGLELELELALADSTQVIRAVEAREEDAYEEGEERGREDCIEELQRRTTVLQDALEAAFGELTPKPIEGVTTPDLVRYAALQAVLDALADSIDD